MIFKKLSRRTWLIALSALAIVLAAALAIFQPWLLFVDKEVDDAIPQVVQPSVTPTEGTTDPTTSTAPEGPVLISTGEFISHEYTTTGTASIYRLPDGSHQLALENLATTNGPDVRVWLSEGPVIEGREGWHTAGSYPHLELSLIKGNLGNQVYPLPEGADPLAWPTVDLWCKAFGVSFGAAALTPVA